MNLKKILLIVLVIVIISGLIYIIGFNNNEPRTDTQSGNSGKLSISVTNFATYDVVRQIAGDKVNLNFLLDPGVDEHSYEPTSQDLITIKNSDIFIYIGGNMENWTDKILNSLDTSTTKVLRLSDMVEIIEEQEVDGAELEEEEGHDEMEYDEHIWTSPANSIVIIQTLADLISEQDSENEEAYQANAKRYIDEVKNIQSQIREIVDNKVRDRLVFGDKMPMQYFINEFGLNVSAAFAGCSTETEPSAATIAYLVSKVKEENIPVVLYIELSRGNIAKTIANETGAEAMQIQTLHNVSKEDFENGETYVSLMARNLEVLKKALQ